MEEHIESTTYDAVKKLYDKLFDSQSKQLIVSTYSGKLPLETYCTTLVCDALVQQVKRVAQEALFAKNATLPMWRLPNELLHRIFRLALPEKQSNTYYAYLYNYRGVRLTWKRFVDEIPTFWAVISCMMDSLALHAALERSQSLPLCVQCYCSFVEQDEYMELLYCSGFGSHFWEQMETHVGRWASLNVVNQTADNIRYFLMESCGALTSLSVSGRDYRDSGWYGRPQELFGGRRPLLQHISVESYILPWDDLNLSELQSLEIIMEPGWSDMMEPSDFAVIFDNTLVLHTLKVSGDYAPSRSEGDFQGLLSAPPTRHDRQPLRNLTLRSIAPHTALHILHHNRAAVDESKIDINLDLSAENLHFLQYIDEIAGYLSGVRINSQQAAMDFHRLFHRSVQITWGGLDLHIISPYPRSHQLPTLVSRLLEAVHAQSRLSVTRLNVKVGPDERGSWDWYPEKKSLFKAAMLSEFPIWFPSLQILVFAGSLSHWLPLLKILSDDESSTLPFPALENIVLDAAHWTYREQIVDPGVLLTATQGVLGARPNLAVEYNQLLVDQQSLDELRSLGPRLTFLNPVVKRKEGPRVRR